MTAGSKVTKALAAGHRYPKAIAERTGLTLRSAQQTIARLQRAGAVRRDGLGYELTPQALEVFHAKHRGAA